MSRTGYFLLASSLLCWAVFAPGAGGAAPKEDRAKLIADLFDQCDTKDRQVSDQKRTTLMSYLRPSDPADLVFVCKAAQDKRKWVRLVALGCLTLYWKHSACEPPDVAGVVLESLKHKDPDIRCAAAHTAMVFAREEPELFRAALKLLADHSQLVETGWGCDLPISAYVAAHVRGLGVKARPFYPQIKRLVRTGTPATKERAIEAILYAAGEDKEQRACLLQFLVDELKRAKDGSSQAVLAGAFWFRWECREAVPHLLELYKCKNVKGQKMKEAIQGNVLLSLSAQGLTPVEFLPRAIEILANTEADVKARAGAASFIAALKGQGRPARTTLLRVTGEKMPRGTKYSFLRTSVDFALTATNDSLDK